MTDPVPFTLIIPAHNEAAVISRCLNTARCGASSAVPFEIIVAANGCTDQTVERARDAAPQAKIIDLAIGSKTAAINAANGEASHFPRIFLDADVECDYPSLVALALALKEPNAMTAAPTIQLDLTQCNWIMKAYYRAWSLQPYAKAGNGGAGCYGLSKEALHKVGKFPDIIADDFWIHTRFPDEQKRYVTNDGEGRPVTSIVYPPRTAREQIKVEARRQNGNAEARRLHPSPYLKQANHTGGLAAAIRSGTNPADLAIFFTVKLSARILARWNRMRGLGKAWSRDASTRQVS